MNANPPPRILVVDDTPENVKLLAAILIGKGYAVVTAASGAEALTQVFEGRWDYGAIGTVTNRAGGLCGEARPGQIPVSQRVLAEVDELVDAGKVANCLSRGFSGRCLCSMREGCDRFDPAPIHA